MNISDQKEMKKHGEKSYPVAVYKSKWSIPCHWHIEDEIILMKKGSADYIINGEKITLRPGDCALCRGGSMHSMNLKQGQEIEFFAIVFEMSYIYNREDVCRDIIDNVDICNYYNADDEKLKNLINMFDEICDVTYEGRFGYQLCVKKLLSEAFDFIIGNGLYRKIKSDPKINIKNISAAIRYIHENYSEKILLADLAASTGYSQSYFEEYFKICTGQTPIEYIISYRIEYARQLLEESEMSITDVAASCGFQNVSYFIRTFRKMYGLTPHRYRVNKIMISVK